MKQIQRVTFLTIALCALCLPATAQRNNGGQHQWRYDGSNGEGYMTIIMPSAATAQNTPKTTAGTDTTTAVSQDKCIDGPFELKPRNAPRTSEQVVLQFVAPSGQGPGSGNWIGVFKNGKPTKKEYLVTWMYLASEHCIERFYLPEGKFEAYIFGKGDLRSDSYSALSEAAELNVRP